MDRREFLKSLGASIASLVFWKPNPDADDDKVVFSAQSEPYIDVWLNGRNVSDMTTRCKVPKEPGQTGWGWVDILLGTWEGKAYHFRADENGDPITRRKFGFVRWAPM